MTVIHPLDDATALVRTENGLLRGATSPLYGNIVGPFGGATAATLLRAVLEHEQRHGDPVALTVNFCGGIADGPFEIAVKVQRTGKYTQHCSAELVQEGSIRATASVVNGVRSASFSHQTGRMPDVPGLETCGPMPTDGAMAWLQRYAFRYIEGAPQFGRRQSEQLQDSRTVMWISDLPERPLDYVSLAAQSDSFILRLFQVRGRRVPMGTVSLTTYFHATPDEIAAQGTAPLLGIVDASRFHANFHDQQMELWGRDGRLLATGAQVVWFRE